MKQRSDVTELCDSLDQKYSNLHSMITSSHAKARRTVAESGVSVERCLSLWIRIQKTMV